MKLTWHGHACFTVESNGYSIVVDPYKAGEVPGFGALNLCANEVVCSHEHDDHNARDAVKTCGGVSPFTVKTVAAVHDHHDGEHRGKNTIHIFEAEGLRVAHLGDLGCELNEKQLAEIGKLDAVMIPVGGFFTIDPEEAAKTVKALGVPVVIPMHYRGEGFGYDLIGEVEPFLAKMENVVKVGSNVFTLPAAPVTAVLTCKG